MHSNNKSEVHYASLSTINIRAHYYENHLPRFKSSGILHSVHW